jgi:hypothetical protein
MMTTTTTYLTLFGHCYSSFSGLACFAPSTLLLVAFHVLFTLSFPQLLSYCEKLIYGYRQLLRYRLEN